MTWFASSTNQTAAVAAHAEPVTFVELDMPDGYVRLHTRTGTITWGTYNWLGVGQLGAIEVGREDTELRPMGFRLTLSGVDATLIQAAREEDYHGRTVRIYRGWLDTQTMALVTTPELRRIGIMDTMPVTLGPNSGTIVVNCESELARWQRVRGLMYTHESQALIYSGDRLFDMVPTIQSRVLDWTKKTLFGAVAGMAAARANAAR